jgi:hypothetical protein
MGLHCSEHPQVLTVWLVHKFRLCAERKSKYQLETEATMQQYIAQIKSDALDPHTPSVHQVEQRKQNLMDQASRAPHRASQELKRSSASLEMKRSHIVAPMV